ncbi:hypothetical protein PRZ48_009451 [Zasmidium cellare]|uniref:Uncharacterized protein n=1 Tax=Zasmidium cellare TaxID=395010 RepID=A0ABR0ECD5_ZASCE|nr:hypothetical protein PRZ48_009451 [Zasmidium cellare]
MPPQDSNGNFLLRINLKPVTPWIWNHMTPLNRKRLYDRQPELRKLASELESGENAKPDADAATEAPDSVSAPEQLSPDDQVLVKENYVTDRQGRFLMFQGGRVGVVRWRTLSARIQASILDWHAQGLEIEGIIQQLIASNAPLTIEDGTGAEEPLYHSQATNPGPP